MKTKTRMLSLTAVTAIVVLLFPASPIAADPTKTSSPAASPAITSDTALGPNLVSNPRFALGKINGLPDGWEQVSPRAGLAPSFKLVKRDGGPVLEAAGSGDPDCIGYVKSVFQADRGKTYAFSVTFSMSDDLNPQENLLFQCFFPGARDGIYKFRRLGNGLVRGDAIITVPGSGRTEAEVRVMFRFSPAGKVWVREVDVHETESKPTRWVRYACTQGRPAGLGDITVALDAAGKLGNVDLILLPEYLNGGTNVEEPLDGPSATLMSAKAKQYRMWIAGGIVRKAADSPKVYNTALLFDREGKRVGAYDKVHPYSPETFAKGITPGRTSVPVFDTEVGRVAFMICYDSWFTDVAELAGLKGADVLLFPTAGYYRSLMTARAADNNLRVVCSVLNQRYGIWDTVGRDVLAPDVDPTHKPLPVGPTFKDVQEVDAGPLKILVASLDLNVSPAPAHNGGTMYEAPANRRNRREQTAYLEHEILEERKRWWTE